MGVPVIRASDTDLMASVRDGCDTLEGGDVAIGKNPPGALVAHERYTPSIWPMTPSAPKRVMIATTGLSRRRASLVTAKIPGLVFATLRRRRKNRLALSAAFCRMGCAASVRLASVSRGSEPEAASASGLVRP